jgi:hypothetical protein
MADPLVVHIEEDDDSVRVDPVTGTTETDQPDGGVVVQLHDHPPSGDGKEDAWFANLADGKISPTELGKIANDLFEAVSEDDRSRKGYLDVRSRGMDLLGLKLEEPKSTVGDASSSPRVCPRSQTLCYLRLCLKVGRMRGPNSCLPRGLLRLIMRVTKPKRKTRSPMPSKGT